MHSLMLYLACRADPLSRVLLNFSTLLAYTGAGRDRGADETVAVYQWTQYGGLATAASVYTAKGEQVGL